MYVEETISKYEKNINPAQAKLFRFMGLASVEGYAVLLLQQLRHQDCDVLTQTFRSRQDNQ